MEKVSVVIPTYNCLTFLPKAIKSVLSQDYQNIEIIIVDDNSNDGSAAYLANLSNEHSNVTVITTHGVGAAAARNIAITHSKGQYVAFLDADDYWYQGKISQQVMVHRKNKHIGMSFTNYDHLDEQYQKIIDCFSYWNKRKDTHDSVYFIDNPLNEIFANNIIGTSTVMVDKSVFSKAGLFNEEISYGEDWQFWLTICEHFSVAVVMKPYTGYLMRQGSITQTDSKRLNNLQSLSKIISDYQQRDTIISKKAMSQAQARLKEGYADYFRTRGDLFSALLYDLHSLIIYPQMRRVKNTLGNLKKCLLPTKGQSNQCQ
ncbi:glycosyltransferase family 2 protein [Photobacterium chitinilyticum]|uniref:Glycosyltransferase family 2 protein n=1 Tax=Photobacterium chitinilyticum TaxID=2485123 RepID=A0A444JWK5_9GAMM|nr:glycosyltransferase family 2 protein [Photobacterium chitinilyticum]RWX57418.1 glycosyltransferase family 2 protein [Photobacterium chitinilyticum]